MEIESVWGIGSSIIFTDYFVHKNVVCWALANPDYAQVTLEILAQKHVIFFVLSQTVCYHIFYK
jgi:hypothetical protein